uniref:Uncharacterized protein n=1 Tax=Timema douglasi TaxID=61478 RepID=A0A7R8Z9P6_TIMDO|nr:unnamed protein product [Timema douglasi]
MANSYLDGLKYSTTVSSKGSKSTTTVVRNVELDAANVPGLSSAVVSIPNGGLKVLVVDTGMDGKLVQILVVCVKTMIVHSLSERTSKVGPGAAKQGQYKNPEYFCYNPISYFEAEIEMAKYRIPQPSSNQNSPMTSLVLTDSSQLTFYNQHLGIYLNVDRQKKQLLNICFFADHMPQPQVRLTVTDGESQARLTSVQEPIHLSQGLGVIPWSNTGLCFRSGPSSFFLDLFRRLSPSSEWFMS